MTLNTVNAVGTILALSPPQGNGQQTTPGWWNMLPLVLLLFAFYFAILRPQQRRQKQHEQLVKGLRAGDRVTTSGGIIGVVVTVKERSVSIRSADTKLEVLKTAISEIGEREGESSQQPQSQSSS